MAKRQWWVLPPLGGRNCVLRNLATSKAATVRFSPPCWPKCSNLINLQPSSTRSRRLCCFGSDGGNILGVTALAGLGYLLRFVLSASGDLACHPGRRHKPPNGRVDEANRPQCN